ncbi:MAG: TetR/AcrR family transcriptional regulator [Roseicyclus sp.]|jgi:AcrR family transcriptional regulator|nr:TetR/AcrR family transcriptional regulator [Roseicyclus sp.]
MSAKQPRQRRSQITEDRFLRAFDELLLSKGFSGTTIDEVAELSGQTRSAFLKRFGSKQGALEVLFERYCDMASETMSSAGRALDDAKAILPYLAYLSQQYEFILLQHKASNRAMHEHFLMNLEVHDLTKKIFRECVELMHMVQVRFLSDGEFTERGAWVAAQLLVTVNYNYVLEAMPAFPYDGDERHRLIANLLNTCLRA